MGRYDRPVIVRFLDHVALGDGCWLWTGAPNGSGYGCFNLGNREVRGAHVAAYMLFKGELEPGAQVCHTCDTKLCVRPSHLWSGSQQDNMIDRSKKGHCTHRKLTDEQVRMIRRSDLSDTELARACGVSPGAVWFVRHGVTHVWVS